MKYWKFSQETKLKQKLFANGGKEVGNFFQDWDHIFSPVISTFDSNESHLETRLGDMLSLTLLPTGEGGGDFYPTSPDYQLPL